MKNKLEPLSDYVEEHETLVDFNTEDFASWEFANDVFNYTKFLKQNLSERYHVNGVNAHPLNRFVPCDLEGNVLVEPPNHKKYLRNDQQRRGFNISEHKQYQQAKERVVFEGLFYGHIVELVFNSLDMELTIEEFIRFLMEETNEFPTLTATGLRLSGKK